MIISSTNWSDRLALLSYATFKHHIHRGNVALASLALQSAKKLFQKGSLETKAWYLLCLELMFAHEALVLITTCIGDFTEFFRDISLDNET